MLSHDHFQWKFSWANINELLYFFENLHREIKFTAEHNFKKISFLDIHIKNENC